MKIDTIMFEFSRGCQKGMFGKYSNKTETAFIDAFDMRDAEFDLAKAVNKAIGSIKNWDDSLQISIRYDYEGLFVRTWFIGADGRDIDNGTLTVARCHADGTFDFDDREHKAVKVIKKEIAIFIDSLEFIEREN